MTTTCETDANKVENKAKLVRIKAKTYKYALCEDVHLALKAPESAGETIYTRGSFQYFHYGCDGSADAGWGCGYRTLQTAISWIINRRRVVEAEITQFVPSIDEIQRILVSVGDKLPQFVGSRDWIGTLEEFYVIDVIFDLPCKILHVQQLNSEQVLTQIKRYFFEYGGFIVMGGLSDTASKGIAGIHSSPADGVSLLIVDPHFVGVPSSKQQLIDKGYVRWINVNEFQESAYNLCFILQK